MRRFVRPLSWPVSIALVGALLSLPMPVRAADPEPPSRTMWPAHVAGVVGAGGLGTAIVFASLQVNAEHAAMVTSAALAKAGAPASSCSIPADRADVTALCATLRRHEEARGWNQDAFTAALGIGLTGLAIAIAWYALAPRSAPGTF